jgi:solute carrier family 25 uncoupling protein 8/9
MATAVATGVEAGSGSGQKKIVAAKKQVGQPQTPGLAMQLATAGVAACIADLITFPLDTTKVRLQVQGEVSVKGEASMQPRGVLGTLVSIVRNEGATALYSGIVPGLQRQMAFSAIRIGAYEPVKSVYVENSGQTSGLGLMGCRIAAGITTGTLAILVAQPTDVVKVRMQAAGSKKVYNGVWDAYKTIGRNEGMMNGLYRGTFPNIGRNCIINVAETVVYDSVKDGFISSGYFVDGFKCHLASAAVAGVTATLVASPVDVVKTRYMNAERGRYRGALHCANVTFKTEGAKAFYKGFNASCLRLVSWNICLWLSYEQLKSLSMAHYANKPNLNK